MGESIEDLLFRPEHTRPQPSFSKVVSSTMPADWSSISTSAANTASWSAVPPGDMLRHIREAVLNVERQCLRETPEYNCVIVLPRVYAAIMKEFGGSFAYRNEQESMTLYGMEVYRASTLVEANRIAFRLRVDGWQPRIFAAEGET